MSRTLVTALCGLIGCTGIVLVLRGLIPRSLPLAAAYERFHRPGIRLADFGDHRDGGMLTDIRIANGPRARNLLGRWGYDFSEIAKDLRVLRRSEAQFAFEKLSAALIGMAVPVFLYFLLAAATVVFPAWFPVLGAIIGLVVGFFFPDLRLREDAAEAREDFVTALTAYLELVRTLIAGGMYVDGALQVASEAGNGPAFTELLSAVDAANTLGEPTFIAFERLANDADLPELASVASSIALATEQGASPDEALSNRAELLSAAQLFAARGQAESATARMAVPSTVLGFAFVLYLAIPAVASLTSLSAGGGF